MRESKKTKNTQSTHARAHTHAHTNKYSSSEKKGGKKSTLMHTLAHVLINILITTMKHWTKYSYSQSKSGVIASEYKRKPINVNNSVNACVKKALHIIHFSALEIS